MTLSIEHAEFLKLHKLNYETIRDSQFVRNIERPLAEAYEKIYQTYIDPSFIVDRFCSACNYNMIKRLYEYAEQNLPEGFDLYAVELPEPEQATEQPKPRRSRPAANTGNE